MCSLGLFITRFLVKDDGRTPYERLRGRDYKGEIVDYAEVVHYKLEAEKVGKLDPFVGVWLGKSLSSDEHLIGTSQGIRRCRSIWRRPENKRWEQARLNAVTGTPWQPKGSLTIVPQDNQRLPARTRNTCTRYAWRRQTTIGVHHCGAPDQTRTYSRMPGMPLLGR